MDTYLSPEMKATGEAIGYDKSLTRALYKALQSSGLHVSNYGTVLVTIADQDKPTAVSYTHLDVYKRQVCRHAPLRQHPAVRLCE